MQTNTEWTVVAIEEGTAYLSASGGGRIRLPIALLPEGTQVGDRVVASTGA